MVLVFVHLTSFGQNHSTYLNHGLNSYLSINFKNSIKNVSLYDF